jgi:hypothetical protein
MVEPGEVSDARLSMSVIYPFPSLLYEQSNIYLGSPAFAYCSGRWKRLTLMRGKKDYFLPGCYS